MVNEVLCKFICHNLCCLLQEQIELGIETEFWGGREERREPEVINVHTERPDAMEELMAVGEWA